MESWSLFFNATENQEYSVQKSRMSRIRRETLMWIEALWLLGLIEKKKGMRKSWEYYDTENQRGLCQVKR
jgi:hypothetical protein